MFKKTGLVAAVVLSMAACGGSGTSGNGDGGPVGGGGSGGSSFGCLASSGTDSQSCAVYKNVVSAVKAGIMSSCTKEGSMIVSACPTADLLGCCTVSSPAGTTEACEYTASGQSASDDMTSCKNANGTWSTTP